MNPKEPAAGSETPIVDAQTFYCEVVCDSDEEPHVKEHLSKVGPYVGADSARTLELALRRRDVLLRRWLDEGLSVSGAPMELVEDTETELNATRKEGADRE